MSTRAGLGIIVVLIVAVALGFALSGCATRPELPPCPRWDAKLFVNDGEVLGMYLAGEENVAKLIGMVEGLAKGTCRLSPREPTL